MSMAPNSTSSISEPIEKMNTLAVALMKVTSMQCFSVFLRPEHIEGYVFSPTQTK